MPGQREGGGEQKALLRAPLSLARHHRQPPLGEPQVQPGGGGVGGGGCGKERRRTCAELYLAPRSTQGAALLASFERGERFVERGLVAPVGGGFDRHAEARGDDHASDAAEPRAIRVLERERKSTRLNCSHY